MSAPLPSTAPDADAAARPRRTLAVLLGVGALVAVVALVVVLVLVGGDDDATPAASPTTDSSTDAPDATAATAEASVSGVPAADEPTRRAAGPATSTADAVPDEPVAVVQAFMDSVIAGDCATAEDLVTAAYLTEQGRCDRAEIPTGLAEQVEVEIGEPEPADDGTVLVPVRVEFGGQAQAADVVLSRVAGRWLISDADI